MAHSHGLPLCSPAFKQALIPLFNNSSLLNILFQFSKPQPGDSMEGGIVAYYEDATTNTLIVAMKDAYQPKTSWSCQPKIPDRTGTLTPDLWKGLENTQQIYDNVGSPVAMIGDIQNFNYPPAHYALKYREGDYTDWHLASYQELLEIEKELPAINAAIQKNGGEPIRTIGPNGKPGVSYWTSSQQAPGRIYIVTFGKEKAERKDHLPFSGSAFTRSVKVIKY